MFVQYVVETSWNVMGTRAETRFSISAKRTSPFKSAWGRQFSRLLAAEVCASAVVMLDTPCSEVVWRVLATHSIRQFPLHFPLPCVTLYHHIWTGVYCHFLFYQYLHCLHVPSSYIKTMTLMRKVFETLRHKRGCGADSISLSSKGKNLMFVWLIW